MREAAAPLVVRPVESSKDVRAWLDLPSRIFAADPDWIEPIRVNERRRISRTKNPFFGFGDAQLFIAWRGSEPIGRISAQINLRHLERYGDDTGHFGFFDCFDDQEAATALIGAASNWLSAKGLKRIVGPLSFTINEEAGLLIDGFGAPPAFLMGHSTPWAGELLERAGLQKVVDLFAYRMRPAEAPAILRRLAGLAAETGRVEIRHVDMSKYRQEVGTLIEIFNDAWADNWGFVPFAKAEIDALISETRFILRGRYGRFLLFDGQPVGVMLALPDINGVIRKGGGRILPGNLFRLSRAFLTQNWRSARIPLLGLKKSMRGSPMAPALLALLVSEFLEESAHYPLEWIEFSWVLETNGAMIKLAELSAGKPAKTYRVYGSDLASLTGSQ